MDQNGFALLVLSYQDESLVGYRIRKGRLVSMISDVGRRNHVPVRKFSGIPAHSMKERWSGLRRIITLETAMY